MKDNWLDNHSWDPTLLLDKRPLTHSVEPVEPEVRRVSTAVEPYPHDNYYDWLYQGFEAGGEG